MCVLLAVLAFATAAAPKKKLRQLRTLIGNRKFYGMCCLFCYHTYVRKLRLQLFPCFIICRLTNRETWLLWIWRFIWIIRWFLWNIRRFLWKIPRVPWQMIGKEKTPPPRLLQHLMNGYAVSHSGLAFRPFCNAFWKCSSSLNPEKSV